MKQDYPHQGTLRIWFDRGFAGLVFAIGCMVLFIAVYPAWQLFASAIAFGLIIAAVLHFPYRSGMPSPSDDHLLKPEYPHPGITMHRIRFDRGFAGLLFPLGCMVLFLTGLPVLWYPFIGALALGVGIAAVLHFLHR